MIPIARRRLLAAAIASAGTALALPAVTARAAATASTPPWSTRPLRVILPFAPGGPGDVVLRAVAARWQARQGQPMLVDHRGGAGGTIGAAAVREAAPDGTTLLFATGDVLVNNTALFRALPYDPVRDFRPLAQIGPVPLVLAVPATLPVHDLASFAAWARGRAIGYGSWGEGSHAHLAGEALLVRTLGLDAVHAPYRGLGPMLQDLAGGQLAAGFGVPPAVGPMAAKGLLRALAVSGTSRSVAMPEVPTLAELGHTHPSLALRQWAAFLAPAGVPDPLAEALEAELAATLSHEDTQRALRLAGFESGRAAGAKEARERLAAELALVPGLIRALGVVAQ